MPSWRAVAAVVTAVILALIAGCSGGTTPHHPPSPKPASSGSDPAAAPPHGGGHTLIPVVTSSCRPGVDAAEFWIIGHRELGVMRSVAPGEVQYALKPANLFVAGAADTPSGAGQTVADFKSYAALRIAIAAHQIPSGVHWLMYDNERWPATPRNEQRSPGYYEAQFATLAHQHGYRVILAPAQDLALGFGTSRLPKGKPAWRRYLSMRLPALSARAGDIFDIQAQAYELPQFRKQNLFLRVIRNSVAQARAANPNITIFAGLSTNRAVSTPDMRHDFLISRGLVAGFWLNIPYFHRPRQRQIARQFLGRVPPPAAASRRTCGRATRSGGAQPGASQSPATPPPTATPTTPPPGTAPPASPLTASPPTVLGAGVGTPARQPPARCSASR